ncbi:MAG: DUF2784 domain-containing protein [Candidatus Kapaibacterium sp.]
MYSFLDIILFTFHAALVAFNLFGWLPKRTRPAHLYTILLTLASWSLLGLFCGFGYCPLTDYHWDVKRQLGETNLPTSCIEYYLDRLTPFDWDASVVDPLVLTLTLTALTGSLLLNWNDWKKRREERFTSKNGNVDSSQTTQP